MIRQPLVNRSWRGRKRVGSRSGAQRFPGYGLSAAYPVITGSLHVRRSAASSLPDVHQGDSERYYNHACWNDKHERDEVGSVGGRHV